MLNDVWKRWDQVSKDLFIFVNDDIFFMAEKNRIQEGFLKFYFRHVSVVAVLLDKSKYRGHSDASYLNFYFNHDHNIWIEKDIIRKAQSSYKGSFVLNILGQLYYLTPDIGTYIYDLKDKKWKVSHPVINDKILQETAKLSVVRVPIALLSVA